MHRIILVFSVFFSAELFGQSTNEQKEIIEKCIAKYAENPVLKFNAVQRFKTFDSDGFYTFGYQAELAI